MMKSPHLKRRRDVHSQKILGTLKPKIPSDRHAMLAKGMGLGPLLTAEKVECAFEVLPKLLQVKKIDFSSNGIRKLNLSKLDLQTLEIDRAEQLVLKDNLLREIDARCLCFVNLKELDLSSNHLTSLIGFNYYFKLEVLNLSGNRLKSLGFLCRTTVCQTLRILNISDNQFSNLSSIGEITTMGNLRALEICGNPLEDNQTTEGFCLISCPLLSSFNEREVTEDIRRKVSEWTQSDKVGKCVLQCVRDFQLILSSGKPLCDFCLGIGFHTVHQHYPKFNEELDELLSITHMQNNAVATRKAILPSSSSNPRWSQRGSAIDNVESTKSQLDAHFQTAGGSNTNPGSHTSSQPCAYGDYCRQRYPPGRDFLKGIEKELLKLPDDDLMDFVARIDEVTAIQK